MGYQETATIQYTWAADVVALYRCDCGRLWNRKDDPRNSQGGEKVTTVRLLPSSHAWSLIQKCFLGLPDSPVARTLHAHSWGLGSMPGWQKYRKERERERKEAKRNTSYLHSRGLHRIFLEEFPNCYTSNNDGKFSSGHRTGKGQFAFQSLRKAMPKNAQTTA